VSNGQETAAAIDDLVPSPTAMTEIVNVPQRTMEGQKSQIGAPGTGLAGFSPQGAMGEINLLKRASITAVNCRLSGKTR
jgi:hypothetical protein